MVSHGQKMKVRGSHLLMENDRAWEAECAGGAWAGHSGGIGVYAEIALGSSLAGYPERGSRSARAEVVLQGRQANTLGGGEEPIFSVGVIGACRMRCRMAFVACGLWFCNRLIL
jgi:hypothetical protein